MILYYGKLWKTMLHAQLAGLPTTTGERAQQEPTGWAPAGMANASAVPGRRMKQSWRLEPS